MMVSPIHGVAPPLPLEPVSQAAGPGGFAQVLGAAIERVDGLQQGGDDALTALATGGDVDLHGSMIALEEAEIALRAMVAVRDGALEAWQQLMNLAI